MLTVQPVVQEMCSKSLHNLADRAESFAFAQQKRKLQQVFFCAQAEF